jgi:thiosulfate dehydrogenase
MKTRKSSCRRCFVLPVACAIVGALLAGGFLSTPSAAVAQGVDPEIWAISRGGQLYDNWIEVLDADPPTEKHPAYPATGKQEGAATWRCKECHGWDYKGEDGVYGEGRRYTGIKGVRRMVMMDAKDIEKIIMNDTHAYTSQMLPARAVEKLALFLSRGQINMDQYIDRETKEVRGNLDRGAAFYQSVCAICHGFDGARMSFENETTASAAFEDPKYLGTLSNRNPWEVLHKIRNGQPGVGMVALRVLSIQDQVDVLSYLQRLPLKKPER